MSWRIAFPLLVALLAGGAARSGEGLFVEAETGLDLGNTGAAMAGADWSAGSVALRLGLHRRGPGFNCGLRFKGFSSGETEFTHQDLDLEAKGQASGFALDGYAGWGWQLDQSWTVSALGGLGFRDYRAGFVTEEFLGQDIDVQVSTRALTLDLGLRLEAALSERVTWTTSLWGGPVIAGDVTADAHWFLFSYRETRDIQAGVFFEFRTGLDLKIVRNLYLNLGVALEAFAVDVNIHDDDEIDGLALSQAAFTVGLTWKF